MNNYILGAIKDPVDSRDIILGNYLIPRKLPRQIDWWDYHLPVKDQGQIPACVGFSSAGMKEIQERIEHMKEFDFDALWLYNECKKVDGIPNEEGTYVRVAMKILQNSGIFAKNIENSPFFRINSYSRLQNITEMRYALVSSGPFVCGVYVYDSFYKSALGWPFYTVHLPQPSERLRGGHAILITGYDDNHHLFTFKNSWGEDWGRKGYAYLTYEFMDKYAMDAWAAIDIEDSLVQAYLKTNKLLLDVEEAKNKK